jgi:hypothetical protein
MKFFTQLSLFRKQNNNTVYYTYKYHLFGEVYLFAKNKTPFGMNYFNDILKKWKLIFTRKQPKAVV